MSEYDSWKTLLEEFRLGYLTEFEVRKELEEMFYDMTEEELEMAEEQLEEIALSMSEDEEPLEMFLDSVPEDEDHSRYSTSHRDIWESGDY